MSNGRVQAAARSAANMTGLQFAGLTRLHELSQGLEAVKEPQKLLPAALETLTALHGTKQGVLSLCDPETGALQVFASRGFDDDFKPGISGLDAGNNPCGLAHKERRRIIIEDTETDPLFDRFREEARRYGFRALYSTPIFNDEKICIGALTIYFPVPRRPNALEMEVADLCVRQLGELLGRIHAELELQKKENMFRTMADCCSIVIWGCHEDGSLDFVNEEYRNYFGLGEEQISGFDWSSLLHPKDRERVVASYKAAIAERKTFHACIRVRRHDGEWRWMEVRGNPFMDAHGHLKYIASAPDVTDIYEAQARLRLADRRKDEFLAVLSHELRNVLAPLQGAVELVRSPRAAQAMREKALDLAERQILQMTRLVDDLADISRIARGTVELRKERLNLCAVAATAAEAARPYMQASRHDFHVDFPSEKLWVWADAARMAQIFSNLLNNAAKYTPPGGKINLSLHREGGEAAIVVRDNGIGIPEGKTESIFQMFSQADNADAFRKGGVGIGLTIVRNLVDLHEGSVCAESPGPGLGSTFTVRLPLIEPRA